MDRLQKWRLGGRGAVAVAVAASFWVAGCGSEGGQEPVAAPPALTETKREPTPAPSGTPAAAAGVAVGAAPPATATPAPVAPARTAAAGELYIDASAWQRTIGPHTRGATWGPLWPVSLQMMPLVQELEIGLLSFPGGEYGDTTNLQEIEIDRFIELCRTLGAEPLIHVRLPGGTPEQAVALLNYTNQRKDYGVKYWAIGNEPNLYRTRFTDTPWDAEHFAAEWRRFAEAMQTADPSILLVGPELAQFAGTTGLTRSDEVLAARWMRTFLEVNGDLVDVVSIHRYPFPHHAHSITTAEELMANPPEWDTRILPDLHGLVLKTVGRTLPLAVTEVNSHWSRAQRQEASPDSLLNAVWWGDVWVRMMREGVEMVTFWLLASRDDQGVWGIVGKYAPRPVHGAFLLTGRVGSELLFAEVGSTFAEQVSAPATWRDDGALTVLLTNRGSAAAGLTPAIENLPTAALALQPAELRRVDAAHTGTQVEGDLPAVGEVWTLPPLLIDIDGSQVAALQ